MTGRALFRVGQLVRHRLFGYRGVIIDLDPEFMLTQEWYNAVAKTRPPKDKPWYHVLVHDSDNQTYVAERNLEPDESTEPINHPELLRYFSGFEDGHYVLARKPH